MKTVTLAIQFDVEELPCCPVALRTTHMHGVVTDENVVYVFHDGKLYKGNFSDWYYDESNGVYSQHNYILYDEDIMYWFDEIPLSSDPNLADVLKILLAQEKN